MDSIAGTVEQKFSLMLLERIDHLTDELERTKQELRKTNERLPPDVPEGITLRDPFERSNIYFMRVNLRILGDIVSVVKNLPYVDYLAYYACETKKLLTINEDRKEVDPESDDSNYYDHAKYGSSPPYNEPNTSGYTVQVIVYLKQHEYISRLAVDVWKHVCEEVISVKNWDVPKFYIKSVSKKWRGYYECLMAASQVKRNIWDIDFMDPDFEMEYECDRGKQRVRPWLPPHNYFDGRLWERYHDNLDYDEFEYNEWFFTEFEVLR